ncbi:LysR family transcriptional regulator [Streptomyces youssoufiensis]
MRSANDGLAENRERTASSIDGLAAAAPWRTFRWYRSQRHYERHASSGLHSAARVAALNRFAAASAYSSLGAAASGLGLNTFTLVARINRIERELGGPLLIRAKRGRPMALLPWGERC